MLQIQDLHKRYGDITALDGCSFNVRPGHMLGFIGRNGAGKTTTMRAVFGLLKPDAGSVLWQGQPLRDADRVRFGYMPEERGLYPKMRADEQLIYLGRLHGMSATSARDAAHRLLEELDLTDRMQSRVEELSQGNQQRVQLAAALIHDPVVLVLDEPFNGLDPIGATTMARVLRERAAAGAAVLFSSHQLDTVEDLCEDVAIIEAGRIRLSGVVADLQRQSAYRVVELGLEPDHSSAALDALLRLDGVTRLPDRAGRSVLQVPAQTDVRSVLSLLDTEVDVRHFSYATPSLADLFTQAVGAAHPPGSDPDRPDAHDVTPRIDA